MGTPTAYQDLNRLWLAGEWQEGAGESFDNLNPYSGETIFSMKAADEAAVDEACEAAKEAQREWAALPPGARAEKMAAVAKLIETRREEIMGWLVREAGSTRVKAALEVQLVQTVFREAATLPYMVEGRILPEDIPGKESRSYRKPLGVVGLISPWNFPLQLTARTLGPALAVGNGVVVKPATDTPVTGGTLFAALLEEVGVPKGLVSVIPGPGSEVGDALVRHRIPRLISFTGSTPVGRKIAKAATESPIMKVLELELGGNGPIVVLDDADLDQAVEAAVWGKFMHSGQICMIANRIIVENGLYDEFVDRFVERTAALNVGDPNDPETFVGPVVNAEQRDGIVELIEAARKESGTTCRLDGSVEGLVIPPHVFADVGPDSCLVNNEIFGPVAPICRAKNEEEALRMANDTDYGLSSAVFTRDIERGVRFARKIEAGMTHVNDQPVNDSPFAPFGGEKNSGLGRFNGRWAVGAFTTDHWITIQHERRPFAFTLEELEKQGG